LRKPVLTIYWALVITVSFFMALMSIMQLNVRFEREEITNRDLPITFAAKMNPGQDEETYNQINDSIRMIAGIASTQFIFTVPEWQGDPSKAEQWNELWRTYLSPIIYASSEYQIHTIEQFESIAEQIQAVTGVTTVVWDQETFEKKHTLLEEMEASQTFFSILSFGTIIALILGLLSSYPVKLRRQFVVRTGVGGAGSQVNPERIWVQVILFHVLVSAILFTVIYWITYAFIPFTLYPGGSPSAMSLFIQGILFVCGIVR